MKKGFLSHKLCFRQSLFNKHILYLTPDNRVDAFTPFMQEEPMTLFCEGILMVVAPDFATQEGNFGRELSQQLLSNQSLTVGEAILQNSYYRSCAVGENSRCALYAVTSIDWSTARLKEGEIKLERIV